MSENIELVQLSPNNYVIAFSKNALAGLREGKSTAINVKAKGSTLKFCFMRDTAYQEKMADFQTTVARQIKNTKWWKRWWKKMFNKRNHLSLHKSPNMKTRDIR